MHKSHPSISLLSLAILAIGWWPSSPGATDTTVEVNPSPVQESVPGPLDGMTFSGLLGPDGKPKDVPDSFVFANGSFVSKECELRCKYTARPYFVRKIGARTEFISETQCPYKEAKITWRGTIEGDTIKGKSTWVVKRWYWSVENTYAFEGKLVDSPSATTSTD